MNSTAIHTIVYTLNSTAGLFRVSQCQEGRERKLTTWDYTENPTATAAWHFRGYMGHEMLPEFGLINMNGRVYDPLVSRFLSADNYIQAPGFSQSLNRYSYCLNNPLKYTDPSGNFFTGIPIIDATAWTMLGASIGAGVGVSATARTVVGAGIGASITGIGAAVPNIGILSDPVSNTSNSFIAGYATGFTSVGGFNNKLNAGWMEGSRRAGLSMEITAGMGLNYTGHETTQTLLGHGIAQARNISGNVTNVEMGPDYILVNDNKSNGGWGLTLGPYINAGGIDEDYTHDPLFVHEYGHTIQSKILGPTYLRVVGGPSVLSGYFDYFNEDIDHNHDETWFEINANQLGNIFYDPDPEFSPEVGYPTSFSEIDWWWFLLFNPLIPYF